MRTAYVTGATAFVSRLTDSSTAGGHREPLAPVPNTPQPVRTRSVASASTLPRETEFAIRLMPSMGSEVYVFRLLLGGSADPDRLHGRSLGRGLVPGRHFTLVRSERAQHLILLPLRHLEEVEGASELRRDLIELSR